jgi:sortase B
MIVALIAAGCYCAYRYYQSDVLPEKQLDEADEKQLELFDRVKPSIDTSSDTDTTEPQENLLEAAEEVNSGVVAWLTIPGTHIDYPVCQAEDNDFYLHNGFDGQYNYELGCPFLDYRCESDFSGLNSIVYGHHMTRQRMFDDIALFKDTAYLQSHRKGTLTLNDGVHNVDFFAYMNVKNTAPAYHAVFVSDSEKEEYIDYIFSDAVYILNYSADDLKRNDDLHLLLLSTCTYEFTDARGILIGIIE